MSSPCSTLRTAVCTAALVGASVVSANTATEVSCGAARIDLVFNLQFPTSPTKPADPHFSPIVCAVHNSSYSMFATTEMATTGLQNVAEMGMPAVLVTELAAAKAAGTVESYTMTSGRIENASSTSTYVTLSGTFTSPLLSCTTMVAPSPDWFTGFRALDLCTEGKVSRASAVPSASVVGWDAGTDNAATYEADNDATDPHEYIALLATRHTSFAGTTFGTVSGTASESSSAMGRALLTLAAVAAAACAF